MSSKSNRPGSNVQAAIWLIGLGILWWTNLWWPGILILIGISMLARVLVGGPAVQQTGGIPVTQDVSGSPAEEKIEDKPETEKEETWKDEEAETPSFIRNEELQGSMAVLPEKCPNCGGPIRENAPKVVWSDDHTARCPFCDTVIKL